MMRRLVESLKRLYQAGDVTIEKLQNMVLEEKISQAEYDYIIA